MASDTIATTVRPSHSVLLIMDPTSNSIPDSMNGQLVAATRACIAVGCLSESDGATTIRLGNPEITAAHSLVFEGAVDTPSHHLALMSIDLQTFLRVETASDSASVEVWANDANEPDDIRVVIK